MAKEYSPEVIAQSFIKQYYELLAKTPDELFRFYKDDSSFTHADGPQAAPTVTGADNIRDRVQELNLAGARFNLHEGSIDAHRSENGGVFVLVTGHCTLLGHLPRMFVQSFFLSRQTSASSYYVKNSILRLLESVQEKGNNSYTDAESQATPAMHTTGVGSHHSHAEYSSVAAAAPPVTTSVTANAEPITSESVLVLIEETSNGIAAEIVAGPDATDEDIKEAIEEATEVVAAVTLQHQVAAASASSGPKSYADLFRSPASAAAAVPVSGGKGNQRAPRATRPAGKAAETATDGQKKEGNKADEAPEGTPAPAAQRKEREGATAGSPSLSVFVKQLPERGVTETELARIFNAVAPIVRVDFHPAKGFAFVDFADAAGVAAVLAKFAQSPAHFSIQDQRFRVEERLAPRSSGPRTSAGGAGRGAGASGHRSGGSGSGPRGSAKPSNDGAAAAAGASTAENSGASRPPKKTKAWGGEGGDGKPVAPKK